MQGLIGANSYRLLFSWKKLRNVSTEHTPWVAACCNILERNAQCEGDRLLASLGRLTGIISDAADASMKRPYQTEQQHNLLLLGIETQAQEVQHNIPPDVALIRESDPLPGVSARLTVKAPVRICSLFASIFLDGATQLDIPRSARKPDPNLQPHRVSTSKLVVCTATMKEFFDYILTLSDETFSYFSGMEWSKLVFTTIIALRLSFPLNELPTWDSDWARSELRLGEFLGRFCEEPGLTPATKKVDVLSACRVVMRTVKTKFDRRAAQYEALSSGSGSRSSGSLGCPMIDGSMAEYIPLWDVDPTQVQMPLTSIAEDPDAQPVFHDLWATMTMSWANEEE